MKLSTRTKKTTQSGVTLDLACAKQKSTAFKIRSLKIKKEKNMSCLELFEIRWSTYLINLKTYNGQYKMHTKLNQAGTFITDNRINGPKHKTFILMT